MKIIKRVGIISFIIIEVVIIIFTISSSMHLEPQPTKEEYNTLKEYCSQISLGASIQEIEKKQVKVVNKIEGNTMEIAISAYNCRVVAKYPLIEAVIQNGKVYQEIDYDNVSYIEESLTAKKSIVVRRGIGTSVAWLIITFAFLDVFKEKKTI